MEFVTKLKDHARVRLVIQESDAINAKMGTLVGRIAFLQQMGDMDTE